MITKKQYIQALKIVKTYEMQSLKLRNVIKK